MKLNKRNTGYLLTGAVLLACCAAVPVLADYSSTVLSQGPLGYWRLNETTLTQPTPPAANLGSLGSAGAGTYNSAPTTGLPGPFAGSQAVALDGGATSVTNAWLSGRDTTNFSFEIWVNPSQLPKFAYMAASVVTASPRSGWYFAQDDGSTFGHGSAFVSRMFYQNGTAPSAEVWAPLTQANTWYHLVLTFDGTTYSLYTNGVLASSATAVGYVPNAGNPLSIGCRSDNAFFWPGLAAEAAMYGAALTPAQVSAHYTTAMTTPASYQATVLGNSPLIYYRFTEAVAPLAANTGTRGAAANGAYIYDSRPGVTGPSGASYPGFEAGNKAVAVSTAGSGYVRIPGLKLNTNTVTISGWVNASNAQNNAAALVVNGSAGSASGLTFDAFGYGSGLGLGYVWNGSDGGWSPTFDSGLATLPDSGWAYVALVVQPAQTTIYLSDQNSANWASVANTSVVNGNAAFSVATTIGAEAGVSAHNFNGAVDEVAIWNRALSAGELYTAYASAIGGVPVRLFTDLQGPSGVVLAGDPIVLTIDVGGTPNLTYTWHKNGSPYTTTTNGVLTIANSTTLDSGNYDVTVSNGIGSPVASQQVSVSVITPTAPQITDTQGFVNRTLYPKGSLNLSVTATGGGLKYLWYKDSVLIPSATSSAFTIASVTNTDAGNYSVSVTNVVGTATNGPVAIAIATVVPGSYEAAMVAANPEAWWRLDEAPGSTYLFDAMGRHDGVYTNLNGTVPPVTLGVAGGLNTNSDTAASFNGTSPGIGLIPFSPNLNAGLATIEGWVKTTVLDGIVPFSQVNASGGMYAQGVSGWWIGEPGAFGNNQNVNTNAQIVPGQWSHIALVFDVTQRGGNGLYYPYTLFVNGVTDGYIWGGNSSAYGVNNGAPFVIGGHNNSGSVADLFFNGQVDEVAVYARKLTPTEIANHFSYQRQLVVAPSFNPAFQPQTVTAGKHVTFTTSVLGTAPITLQWYKGSTLLSGATTATYDVPSAAVGDTGTYTLWATNAGGVASQSVNLTVIAQTSSANVTNGLVLHLKFDGDYSDSSGRGNNGTTVGSPSIVGGKVGSGAFHYSTDNTAGTHNYLSLGTPSDLQFGASTDFSVAYWVRLPVGYALGDLPFLCSATNSYGNQGLTIAPTYGPGGGTPGGWSWYLADDAGHGAGLYGPANTINDGQWHHLVHAFTRGAVGATYLDGVLVNQTSIANIGNINTGPFNIGQDPTGAYVETGSGDLDDMGVWTRALTPLEVAEIESAGRTAGNSFDTVAPPSVTITVTRNGSQLTLSWSTGTLQQSDTLGAGANWAPVSGATAPSYTFTPATTGNKFYRVQVQ